MDNRHRAVAPNIEDVTKSRVLVHLSRKPRINNIFSGFLRPVMQVDGVKNIGLRFFGPECPGDSLLKATESGKSANSTTFKRWAKRLFLKGQFNWSVRYAQKMDADLFVVWNGVKGHRRLLVDAVRMLGRAVVFFEESPLPGRITVDFQGVNYGSSLPRDLGFYQSWADEAKVDLSDWRRLGQGMAPRETTREDMGQAAAGTNLTQENYIFCALQVPGDSQITIYGDWIKSVDHMIDVMAQAAQHLPDGWHVRIKEHPSAKTSFAEKLAGLACDKFRVDNQTNTFEQVAASRAVVNINSSVGLQSFFYDKPVLVLGDAFYAFDGVAQKIKSNEDLAQAFRSPEMLDFDAHARDLLMSYLDRRYYPAEADIIAGKYTLCDVLARDKERDDIIASLG